MSKERCATCGNYVSGKVIYRGVFVPELGECRRGEPEVGLDPWPTVKGDEDWCGEWKKKP